MDLSKLKPAKGAVKKRKRIGRGEGSGYAGTAGRGHKGARSRSGYKEKFGFEGGQMPLQRRVPKFGFKNKRRVSYLPLNLEDLQRLADKYKWKKVDVEKLQEKHVVARKTKIKVLGRGTLKAKLEVTADAFSKTAAKAIEEAGGKAVKRKLDKPKKQKQKHPPQTPKNKINPKSKRPKS